MARIRQLSDQLASQIAAGEVVERPASVVKELVENALDAGAGLVRVALVAGGKAAIEVVDDGGGMGADDALLAFDRHATSKIAAIGDLEQVATLGFRGEALAAIAAVAKVELATAERPGEGTHVRIEGGRVLAVEPQALPVGTTISVRSLFFNVPARRKFLKAPATELRRCVEVVEGYALARPEVRFALTHEGRALLETAAGERSLGGLRNRIAGLFGGGLARELVEIPAPAEPLPFHAWGLIGSPKSAGTRRSFVFVNRRLVRDRALLAAFYRAVREEWRGDELPALFLFLDLPAEEVDVNVHPTKAEVRFRDPRLPDRLAEQLRRALAAARGEEPAPLRTATFLPAVPLLGQGLGSFWGGPSAAPSGEPAPDDAASLGGVGEQAPHAWPPEDVIPAAEVGERPASWLGQSGRPWNETGGPAIESPGRLAEAAYAPLDRAPIPLSGRSGEARPFRLLGQYKGTLVLLEGPDGLYLIDQHVAHERLLFERLRRAMASERPASQRLLEPVLLELGGAERMRLLELAAELEPLGFTLVELSAGALGLTAAPAVLTPAAAERLLATLAARSEGDTSELAARVLEAFAASLACKAAVKMHHGLTANEMERLVVELFAAEQPFACPHGRPIILTLSDADLERRLGRR